MLENSQLSNIIAISSVTVSISFLIYFAVKTLITSNLFQKGVNLFQAKDYAGAEAAFRQVIAINSTNDVVRLLLGDLLNHQGKIEEAKEVFNDVITRSPKNPDAYLRLANIQLLQDEKAEALQNLQTSKALFQKQRQPQKAATIEKILKEIGNR
ncbi:MAG: tetratricopeptide repeat protein [Sphaerospermopsis kisseleviana]|jgi:TolA-binding protein|nr:MULTISPECIES: tetratricopeptide repeat protein [Sphaerospermopsis]MBD2131363.1 tetratricopeptide repeat protein [Sphaerospermopsis sp. FACHB-1094]MBD2146945.1 tetratricopeptide repeat protein [Sphaerospermopsis sp. FACHB-1194]MDB9440300.1 tetratricopeptide repeat protein [Sphaerospermopsis kisseleviana CS-549]MEB3151306.1 tetratricopeptide repeat protein [Sphaerospermopsis sp.]